MARDKGLKEIIRDDLRDTAGLTGKAMFGGWAWLLNGNLLCGARNDGLLIRLGKGNDAWALKEPGIVPMINGGRAMQGWVRADPDAFGDDKLQKAIGRSPPLHPVSAKEIGVLHAPKSFDFNIPSAPSNSPAPWSCTVPLGVR